jgi:DNA-binding transcriptional regulator YhcF (GntR family)
MTSPTPRLGVISKPLLADAVHDRLLESVVRGELRVGERLNVDSLADSFGVSRTPVREALARLSHARFVEISRNSSTVVAQWGRADMRARARMIGDVVRGVVLDPDSDLSGLAVPLDGGPVERFTWTADRIAERATAPLARQLVGELAAPLAIYLDTMAASTDSAEHADAHVPCRSRADAAFAFLAETLVSATNDGQRERIAEAVDDVTAVFTDALRPGPSAP